MMQDVARALYAKQMRLDLTNDAAATGSVITGSVRLRCSGFVWETTGVLA